MREVAGRRRQNGNAAKDDCGQSEVDRGEGIAHREAQRRLIEGWRTAMPEIATWMIAMAKDDLALTVKNLDGDWGLRGVRVKGGTTRDIPVPEPVMRYLHAYVHDVLPTVV